MSDVERMATPVMYPPASILTPHEQYLGYQDTANRELVAGWAWDSHNPATPLTVEIYDGGALVGTIVADRYRADLRRAGVGDGRHSFIFPLPKPIRSLAPHLLTTRIAGTAVVLRDTTTLDMPRPVSRRDTLHIAPIAHFSLSPLARWWYYTVLKALFRLFPQPVWRLPAALFAWIMVFLDAEGRGLDTALLAALDWPDSPVVRWRMHWRRCYLHQAHLVLSLQTQRFTVPWLMRQIRPLGAPPPGGAILIMPHHSAQLLSSPWLSQFLPKMATISAEQPDQDTVTTDPTLRLHWQQMRYSRERVSKSQVFTRCNAARRGLQLLRDGGYLVITPDDPTGDDAPVSFLGRMMPMPQGTAWLAQRSGKPIIPVMLLPSGGAWRLWFGAPVPPTQEGVVMALTQSLRRSPASWMRFIAMMWLNSPVCFEDAVSPGSVRASYPTRSRRRAEWHVIDAMIAQRPR